MLLLQYQQRKTYFWLHVDLLVDCSIVLRLRLSARFELTFHAFTQRDYLYAMIKGSPSSKLVTNPYAAYMVSNKDLFYALFYFLLLYSKKKSCLLRI